MTPLQNKIREILEKLQETEVEKVIYNGQESWLSCYKLDPETALSQITEAVVRRIKEKEIERPLNLDKQSYNQGYNQALQDIINEVRNDNRRSIKSDYR